jgi:hypothetical protein
MDDGGLSLAAVPAQQTGHKTVWNLDDRYRQAKKQNDDDDDNKEEVENGTRTESIQEGSNLTHDSFPSDS